MLQKTAILCICFIAAIFILPCKSLAQLHPDFISDNSGGCSPLAIQFTNTTTGASSSAVFSWSFGNGNMSTLPNPGAVFYNATTYIVMLTVTDSNKSASASHAITVYKSPSLDFSCSIEKGCVPVSAGFTGKATAAGGSVADYYWDFGDGITQSSGSNNGVTHIYNTAQQPAVSLTVTDNHGCQSTLVKQKIISVLPALVASFTTDKAILCKITDGAKFVNNSTGPGTLSYQWNFGDGGTSTAAQPSHIFNTAGIYSIGLKVNSSEGCTITNTQNNLINAANFKSVIGIAGPLCDNNNIGFENKSTPAPDQSFWKFSDGSSYITIGNDSVVHNFSANGSYSIQLTNTFSSCSDIVTKIVQVLKSPVLQGFVMDLTTPCGSPALVNFNDTSAAAVAWQWSSSGFSNLQSTDKATSYTYPYDDTYNVTLKITDAAGCYAYASKKLDIYKPQVTVSTPQDMYGNGVTSCGPQTVHLAVSTSTPIKTYSWDLGDGATSTLAAPVHLYSKAGNYYVKLLYTTVSGCTGEADLYYPIAIRNQVKANFSVDNTSICGDNIVTFNNLTPIADYYGYYWDFGDTQTGITSYNQGYNNIMHQYGDSGLYTITLIASNGICPDTVTKKNYLKVSSPFPKISGHTNTCEGTRGTVTFTQASAQVISGTWDFGDGTTAPFLNQPSTQHTYFKTGYYKVVLTTTNGSCTVGDSLFVPVLLKQHPVLSADKSIACSLDDFVKLTYSNLEVNPAPYGYEGYGYGGWFHSDGTFAIGQVGTGDLTQIPFVMTVGDFSPGHGLYSIVTSATFGCMDTTNLVPLTIKGPIAGFKQDNPSSCGGSNTVVLEDTSQAQMGVALVSWQWDFGNGQGQTYNHGGKITHTYNYPGLYNVYLTVTDAGGCHSFFAGYANATPNSLQASFTASSINISPGSSVSFTNTSQTSDNANTNYKWLFGDGSQALTTDAAKTYSLPGTYTVKLIAHNIIKGCSDTASTTLIVKYVNAAFAINSAYISNSKCPPVVVSFTNTSSNVTSIFWDFGDGSTASNVFNPSHVYTKAGRYTVTVTTHSDNGTAYSTKDSVIIDQPSVSIKASTLHSCTAQAVTFSFIAKDANSYLWDFGDGDVYEAKDTSATHNYSAGIYIPRLIAINANGCSTSANAGDTIVIDSLHVALGNVPGKICVPKQIFFSPDIVSISGNNAPQSLIYRWNFGTGNGQDTSNQIHPSFLYQQPGTYLLTLKVQSPYGCSRQVSKNIVGSQGLGPFITGPSDICQNTNAIFKGNISMPGQPDWLWIFADGSTINQQNPPPREFINSGIFTVKLVVNDNGCTDTVVHSLVVHAKPVAAISPHEISLCQGKHVTLTASGGNNYKWYPSDALDNTVSAVVNASPLQSISYGVIVSDSYGCINKDSVDVQVIQPFTMQAETEAKVCSGKSISLHVSGADAYLWINPTTGLNNTAIADPVATPVTTITYTVTGTDSHKCFTDTANIKVTVAPPPVADAGESAIILAGTNYQLHPTASQDVVQWNWSPSQSLSCNNCPSPVAHPSGPEVYTLTVTNAAGCTASDTVSLKLFCSESRIFIPTAFTPNGDNLNEVFSIKGDGIRIVNYFRIYDRWGTLVFEHSNFQIGDKSGSWNGRYKGQLVSQGTYIYFAEMSCNEQTFTQKGSVTVLY